MRDSSLSASTQAVIAAEVGDLDLGYAYWREAALTDLHDLHNNIHQGLHIASLAGAWNAAVAGFGGMRDHNGQLTFAPRLPPRLTRLTFRLSFQGRCLAVTVGKATATYRLIFGERLQTRHHHGEPITIESTSTLTLPIPPPPAIGPSNNQPDAAHTACETASTSPPQGEAKH